MTESEIKEKLKCLTDDELDALYDTCKIIVSIKELSEQEKTEIVQYLIDKAYETR